MSEKEMSWGTRRELKYLQRIANDQPKLEGYYAAALRRTKWGPIKADIILAWCEKRLKYRAKKEANHERR